MTTYTSLLLPKPASTDHVRLWEHIGNLADAVEDLLGDLPDEIVAFGNGTNTIVTGAATWGALPTTAASVVMTNPSATLDMLVEVAYGAWLSSTSGDVRLNVIASGGLTILDGVAVGGAAGWGEVPQSTFATSGQFSGKYTCRIPAGAAAVTFVTRGYRSAAAGTQSVNYPTVRVTPLRFCAP